MAVCVTCIIGATLWVRRVNGLDGQEEADADNIPEGGAVITAKVAAKFTLPPTEKQRGLSKAANTGDASLMQNSALRKVLEKSMKNALTNF